MIEVMGDKSIRFFLALWLGKLMVLVLRLAGRSAATALPGLLALQIDSFFLRRFNQQFEEETVVVTGTNGKTTTASLIGQILRNADFSTVHNQAGSNLLRGIASALIQNADFLGKIKADFGIFEVDEFALPQVLKELTPRVIVLLNLFRDQLDRYGELDTIVEKWRETLEIFNLSRLRREKYRRSRYFQSSIFNETKKPVLIANADDPELYYLGEELEKDYEVHFFGLNNPSLYLDKMPHAADSIFCPKCGGRLNYHGVYLSHLGDYSCAGCLFSNIDDKLKIKDHPSFAKATEGVPRSFNEKGQKSNLQIKNQKLMGVYNLYNQEAAVATAEILGVPGDKIESALQTFKPVFGRQEEFEIEGKKVKILLSKNPTGFNEAIRTLGALLPRGVSFARSRTQAPPLAHESSPAAENLGLEILLVLNDLIPDGRDVSWIWDVDFEELVAATRQFIVSGRRAYDLALRLKYAGVKNDRILTEPTLKKAIKMGFSKIGRGETLFILPTYSAMLETRRILKGKALL